MIRIVKMEMDEEKIPGFLAFFQTIKEKVRGQEGCSHLELLRDINNPSILFTYSIWEDEKYLNQYRDSEFFKMVWAETKKNFIARPGAWSVETIEKLA